MTKPIEFSQKGDHFASMYQDTNRDKYNTIEEPEDENLYRNILNADLRIAPRTGQTGKDYLTELNIHIKNSAKKNITTHIIKGVRGRPWYTHLRGDGCFMCEDMNMIHTLYSTMRLIIDKYPNFKF